MPVAPPRPSICRYSAVRSPPFQKLLSKRSASSCARDSSARLRKMMAQDMSEASSSRPMTTCTIGLALQHQPDDREFIVHDILHDSSCEAGLEQSVRQRPRAECLARRRRPRACRLRAAAPPRRAITSCWKRIEAARPSRHRPQVTIAARRRAARACGSSTFTSTTANMKPCSLRELALRMPERAQPFGARALHELEVVGVVDDAAAIGVFPVDARAPGEVPPLRVTARPRTAAAGAARAPAPCRPKCR